MKWFKIDLVENNSETQNEFFYNFLDVFTRNKRPEFLKLYKTNLTQPKYYIECNEDCESFISDLLKNYKANSSAEPSGEEIALLVGREG